ncbi:BREX-2 system phosphatase PglZ [Accumulibacter sp.]|uniref:BREX-2 system phosphatase PglZ n=1 Tax=Accumulibacter sp. TaxID=2053492 RepID=UPI002B50D10B|nr:BREX-2 system phosphatase PglZ [Accumulibacter sp.]HRF06134.1 BREX-2 system phosphatase PglZ [Accumulibacter sp.]
MNGAAGPLSLPQIEAQALAVLERASDAKVIAIQTRTQAAWPDAINLSGRQFRLHWCASPLMAREALSALEEGAVEQAGPGLILLTPLSARDLGGDVVARLARAQVFQPDAWGMVQQLFKAREIDARLGRFRWMAQLLVERATMGAYSPVPNGFLDMDTAWRCILSRCLGLDASRPDAATLLSWSLGNDSAGDFDELPDQAKPQIAAWLGDSAGAVGTLVMRSVMAGNTQDAVPLGLVCGVALSAQGEGVHDLAAAAIRLERFMGDQRIGIAEGRLWAADAAKCLKALTPALRHEVIERAELLLRELHIDAYAHLSDVLPLGLEQRLGLLAEALKTFIATPSTAPLQAVERAADSVARHAHPDPASTRMLRVKMAVRLCRWMMAERPESKGRNGRQATGFHELAQLYAREGAFVDWARFKLLGGDELPGLSSAFVALRDAARKKADAFNLAFAKALQVWNREPRAEAACLPVEAIMERLLAPLAQQAPVLLLVADGLSYSIFRELCLDLEALGWDEQLAGPTPMLAVGIAALPTITEVSRTSLLSGRLVAGAAPQEKTAFSAHPALVGASRAGTAPLVFHKGDLADAEGLSSTVRDAIASTQQQVVAVVYNAVDDHLSGSNQIQVRWTIDDLRLLGPLLSEARRARRVLIVTADHGHVIDDGTVQRGQGEGDRWRLPSGTPDASELLFEGGRVKTASGNAVVCTWSEGVRHGAKKNGYHGGVSAQEVVVPLSVFTPRNMVLKGWQVAAASQPDWWAPLEVPLPAGGAETPALPKKPPKAKPPAAPTPQIDLFGGALPVSAVDPEVHWIDALQASPAYRAQKALAARVAPADTDVRSLLEALAARGGKLSKAALAQRLGMPAMRISGFVNAAKRVLNVDQAAVLVLDETAGTVELNRELLGRQFRVTGRRGAGCDEAQAP